MKKRIVLIVLVITALTGIMSGCGSKSDNNDELRAKMSSLYGENKVITKEYDETLAAKCINGTFVGTEDKGVISYKGIPYAESPTGKLRWKEPVSASPSDEVYEAYYYGKSPVQTELESEKASFYKQGEDCLNLNVWTSDKTASSNKPVMVFLHGGAYGWGGTSDPLYDGQNFVEENDDVVFVTIGYRVGMMGFVDFSSVEGGEDFTKSGNLGLLDQISGLKWIKNNIEAFGGDPNNVTIFGESAGGGSVSLLPLIDDAKGLFQRAIAQSGTISLTFSKEECQNLTQLIIEKTGAKSMEDLMALSEEEIIQLNTEVMTSGVNEYNNQPQRDGVVLPEDVYELYARGAASDIDMMIGTTKDEARYWIDEVGGLTSYKLLLPIFYENTLKRFSDEDMAYVDQFMSLQKDSQVWNITEFFNEMFFRIPAIEQASLHSQNGGNTYKYYWTYPTSSKIHGALHAVELPYVLNNLDSKFFEDDVNKPELAKDVQRMWVNFAKTGNPSIDKISWPKYDTSTRATMVLGDEIKVENDLLGEQREALSNLLKYKVPATYANLSFNVPFVYKLVGIPIAILAILVGGFVILRKKKKNKQE